MNYNYVHKKFQWNTPHVFKVINNLFEAGEKP